MFKNIFIYLQLYKNKFLKRENLFSKHFISQLKAGFVSDVNEVVKLHQYVQLKVTEVDENRKQIQLTMVI